MWVGGCVRFVRGGGQEENFDKMRIVAGVVFFNVNKIQLFFFNNIILMMKENMNYKHLFLLNCIFIGFRSNI